MGHVTNTVCTQVLTYVSQHNEGQRKLTQVMQGELRLCFSTWSIESFRGLALPQLFHHWIILATNATHSVTGSCTTNKKQLLK